MSAASFFVPGIPAPQGSKTGYVVGGRAVVVDKNPAVLKPWRVAIAAYASNYRVDPGPVQVALIFVMPRPKRPKYPVPATKPDIDKLVRAVLDGLVQGKLIEDDSLVVSLIASERYSTEESIPGVHIAVQPIGAT